MHALLRLLTLSLLLATIACHSSSKLLDENADNLRDARTVAATFYAEYGAEIGLKDVPFVTLGVDGIVGHAYDSDHNVLFVTSYGQADFETRKFFGKAAGADHGQEVYNQLAYRFSTAHQLMHLYYGRLPITRTNHYDSETHINVLTWLFLKKYNMLPENESKLLETLASMNKELSEYYPDVAKDETLLTEFLVEDSHSYWYSTSASIIKAKELARNVNNQQNYLASLSNGSTASAGR